MCCMFMFKAIEVTKKHKLIYQMPCFIIRYKLKITEWKYIYTGEEN